MAWETAPTKEEEEEGRKNNLFGSSPCLPPSAFGREFKLQEEEEAPDTYYVFSACRSRRFWVCGETEVKIGCCLQKKKEKLL